MDKRRAVKVTFIVSLYYCLSQSSSNSSVGLELAWQGLVSVHPIIASWFRERIFLSQSPFLTCTHTLAPSLQALFLCWDPQLQHLLLSMLLMPPCLLDFDCLPNHSFPSKTSPEKVVPLLFPFWTYLVIPTSWRSTEKSQSMFLSPVPCLKHSSVIDVNIIHWESQGILHFGGTFLKVGKNAI